MHFPQPKNWLAAPYILPTAGALAAALATSVIISHCIKNGGAQLTNATMLFLGIVPLHVIAPAVFLYKLAPAILQLGTAQTLQLFPSTPTDRSLVRRLLRLYLIMLPMSIIATTCVSLILHAVGCSPQQQPIIRMLQSPNAGLPFAAMTVAAAVILAPLAEELIFRLGIYSSMQAFVSKNTATVVTALVFAAMHGLWHSIPTLFIIGIFLQKAKEEGGLLQAVLLHAAYNLTQLLFLFCVLKLIGNFPDQG